MVVGHFSHKVDHDQPDLNTNLLKNQYGSFKFDYTAASQSGIQICTDTNYGGTCELHSLTPTDVCIPLTQAAAQEKSIRLLGSDAGDYGADMFHDTNCGTFSGRYDHDAPDLGLSDNQFSSIRITYTGQASNGYQIFQDANYSGYSQTFHYTSHDTCITLDKSGHEETHFNS